MPAANRLPVAHAAKQSPIASVGNDVVDNIRLHMPTDRKASNAKRVAPTIFLGITIPPRIISALAKPWSRTITPRMPHQLAWSVFSDVFQQRPTAIIIADPIWVGARLMTAHGPQSGT